MSDLSRLDSKCGRGTWRGSWYPTYPPSGKADSSDGIRQQRPAERPYKPILSCLFSTIAVRMSNAVLALAVHSPSVLQKRGGKDSLMSRIIWTQLVFRLVGALLRVHT
jgi:hypothetical protein